MSASAAIPLANAPEVEPDTCWSRIGVWGDRQCGELQKHIHCHNCPAYSAAAAQMLDGELPPAYSQQWTEHFARTKEESSQETQSIIILRVGPEWLALPVNFLVEVVGRRPVHSLPHSRNSFIKGLVNIRGQLLVCVSLT